MAEQQRTTAHSRAAKGYGGRQNQKKKNQDSSAFKFNFLVRALDCAKEFGQFWVEGNVGM